MTLQILLDKKNISKYQLSKISGVPKTTIMDMCSGKSSIGRCSARTIYQIANALECSMEEIMLLDEPTKYDTLTGLPTDKSYLECGLPEYLIESVEKMIASWKKIDKGEEDLRWDIYWCDLNADINAAETDNYISSEQAWYLREKYLRMKRGEQ
ncbi:MAG: helix-turn-helix transcriptional regulator [Ruminococcaceae bacterium]|nr:helix-turn-helix transcriptional regulator [Oscillospiraceae bacterium]